MRKWFVLALVLSGCTGRNDSCGKDFLLLWPNAMGDYVLQAVTLASLNSPYEVSGPVAKVYMANRLDRDGFSGPVGAPNLTRADGLCVPQDIDSHLVLGAYAMMERIHHFESGIGVADLVPWPRTIGVNLQLRASPDKAHNNAHYFPEPDAIGVVPYNHDGVPMGLNHGVMAHEHFHAHFQRYVNRPVGLAVSHAVEDLSKADLGTALGRNVLVLRGWNEGLADFYAAVVSGSTEFFKASLPRFAAARAVDGPVFKLSTGEAFADGIGGQKAGHPQQAEGLTYVIGTGVARALWQVARSGSISREELVRQVLRRLPELSDRVIPQVANETLDQGLVLEIVLKDVELNTQACAAIESVVSKSVYRRGFRRCSERSS